MVYAIILLIVLFFLILGVAYYYISFIKSLYITKVPYVGSFQRQLDIMKQLNLEKGKTIIDLGCGDGKALRFFEKQFGLKGFGYDINSFAIFYGNMLNKISKSNVKLVKDDFIGKDIGSFDYIYLYLFPEFMEKIEDWIFESKGKETIIISNTFKFKKHKPFKIVGDKIYLYK